MAFKLHLLSYEAVCMNKINLQGLSLSGNLNDPSLKEEGDNILGALFSIPINEKNNTEISEFIIPTKLFDFFENNNFDSFKNNNIENPSKLLNKQNLSYRLIFDKIPLSQNLKKLIKLRKLDKKNFFSKGDDYQILFTANSSKSRIISKISKSLAIKISKIGKIISISQKSQIIDQKGKKIGLKDKGYYHQF